ncbi:hypothetical protein V865_006387 [Kwoniella europaea PYCC6329]|uniref:Uncharacterized protein n=1 Tax=Kwoniella europaea PYCC6329 TaxID=1423913 RepID=A0AAX4KP48_9TREE
MSAIQTVSSASFPLKPHNSPAVVVTSPGLIFCSGQVGKSADIKEATFQSLTNLKDVLELGGSSLSKIVKINIFILDLDNFDAMNEAFVSFLPDPKPSRTCIQAARLPSDATIEIECIAQV